MSIINIVLFEDRDVVFRGEDSPAVGVFWGRAGAAEGEKQVWDDSIHIAVLDPFIEIIGVEVESLHVEPAELYCSFQAAKAMVDL